MKLSVAAAGGVAATAAAGVAHSHPQGPVPLGSRVKREASVDAAVSGTPSQVAVNVKSRSSRADQERLQALAQKKLAEREQRSRLRAGHAQAQVGGH